jgi:membrane dipeptidase
MNQIVRVAFAAALAAAPLLAQAPGRQKRTVGDAEVVRVHRSAILIDTHNDIPSDTVAGLDIGKPNTDHMTDLPRMKKGGMGAQFFAAYVAPKYVEGNHAANRALEMIDTVRHDIIEKYANDFLFATTAADIRRAHKQHKIAALLGLEGGHAIEDSLRLLRRYYDEGVRYMTLTHDGGHLARFRQDFLGRAGGQQSADLRVAFFLPRHNARAAQHDRRNDRGARQEGRRGAN